MSAATPDDLRALGGMVAVHNDYRLNGKPYTFWQMTFPIGPVLNGKPTLIALIGEGESDAAALDAIRTQYRALTAKSAA